MNIENDQHEIRKDLKYYYSDSNIRITNTYVRFYSSFYVVLHINSVHMKTVRAELLGPALLGFVAGFIVGFASGSILSRVTATSGLETLVGAIAGLIGLFISVQLQKDSYAVEIRLSSGETRSLVSPDKQYVEEITNKIMKSVSDNQLGLRQ